MKKIIKIIIIILIIVSLLVGLVAGLKVIRKKNAKKVAVYSVKSVMLDPGFFMEDSTSYGEIGSDKVQSVYVSDTQKVKEVLVHEGQEVKRGDILLTYDSTLTELQLERAGNELRQEEYNLQKAIDDLEIINHLQPFDEDDDGDMYDDYDYDDGLDDGFDDLTEDMDEETESDEESDSETENDSEDGNEDNEDEEDKHYEPQETGVLLSGSGTIDDPYIYLWSPEDILSDKKLLAMFTPNVSYADKPKENDAEEYDNMDEQDEQYEPISPDEENTGPDEFLTENTNIQDTVIEEYAGAMASVDVEFAPDSQVESAESTEKTESAEEIVFDEPVKEENHDEKSTDENPEEDIKEENTEEVQMEDKKTEETESHPDEEIEVPFDNSDIYEAIEKAENEFAPEENKTESNKPQKEESTVPEHLKNAPGDIYVVLEMHKDNNADAPVMHKIGMHLIRDGVKVMIQLFDPDKKEQEDESEEEESESTEESEDSEDDQESDIAEIDDEYDDEYGDELGDEPLDDDFGDYSYDNDYEGDEEENESVRNDRVNPNGRYTAEEINSLKRETERDIRDMTISVKKAELNLREMENEYNNSAVKSKLNGVVKTIRDPSEESNEPVMVISSGGGYTVVVSIGELDIPNISKGQEVKIGSLMDDESEYKGNIIEIGDYPKSNTDSFSNGNPNVSYYPCKIEIEDSASFHDVEYIGVSLDTGKEKSGLYLEPMFVRSDSKGKYVYVKGKDGKLTRRNIRTGKPLDAYTLEIKSGVSKNDYIAFPYGSNVFEGAETEEATIDELYS